MFCYHVDLLNGNSAALFVNGDYFSFFVFIFAGDNLNSIAFFNFSW